ncbi:MAG: DUF1848 domain-containing protein, partial [Candidatus Cloacimonetes bacterium]|nr:DUF1848 domain-containing protein [Candidatus Cloacimonadota bacterium]
LPRDVTAFVFWSKYPAPLISKLKNLRDYRYYFLYTINNYEAPLENYLPTIDKRLMVFRRLSDLLGSERVIWRYDPVIISPLLDRYFHQKAFSSLCQKLGNYTRRCIISFLDPYQRSRKNLLEFNLRTADPDLAMNILKDFKDIAQAYNINLQTCAESPELANAGVKQGKCIDEDILKQLFGIVIPYQKDPGQRKQCRCCHSIDIGAYDTCLYYCVYCYANSRFPLSRRNFTGHDPEAEFLLNKKR